jgi:hypothetical protein
MSRSRIRSRIARSRASFSALAALLTTLAVSPVSAQDDCRSLGRPPEGDATSAQRTALEAFSRGSRATESERWDNAEQCFRLAWELSHVALARYNQAVALRALGHHREARDAFDEALAAGLDETRAPLATTMRAEAAANVSGILIDGVPPDVEAEVELDGLPVDVVPGQPIECDGGRRSVVVRAPGYTPFTWSGEVIAGSVAAVHVDLQRIPSGGNVLEEPLFWIITGVVLAGAGIGIGIYAQDQAQLRGEARMGYVVDL